MTFFFDFDGYLLFLQHWVNLSKNTLILIFFFFLWEPWGHINSVHIATVMVRVSQT